MRYLGLNMDQRNRDYYESNPLNSKAACILERGGREQKRGEGKV